MTGWTNEREPAAVDGLQRYARGKRRRPPGGLGRDRVGVELDRPVDRGQPREMLGGVCARELIRRRGAIDPGAPEDGDALLPLRMRSGRVKVGERRVRQRLDAASSSRPASTRRPSPSAAAAPAAQSGW